MLRRAFNLELLNQAEKLIKRVLEDCLLHHTPGFPTPRRSAFKFNAQASIAWARLVSIL